VFSARRGETGRAIGRTFAAARRAADANQSSLPSPPPTSPPGWAAVSRSAADVSIAVNEGGGAHAAVGWHAAGIMLTWCCSSHLLRACPRCPGGSGAGRGCRSFNVSTSRRRRDRPSRRGDGSYRRRKQGLLRGVMIGAIISLVLLIRGASRPHVAVPAHPGTWRFSDRERNPRMK
jgi:hypothetical protein